MICPVDLVLLLLILHVSSASFRWQVLNTFGHTFFWHHYTVHLSCSLKKRTSALLKAFKFLFLRQPFEIFNNTCEKADFVWKLTLCLQTSCSKSILKCRLFYACTVCTLVADRGCEHVQEWDFLSGGTEAPVLHHQPESGCNQCF